MKGDLALHSTPREQDTTWSPSSRGQTTTHSHEAFQQADARHVGVRRLWTSPPEPPEGQSETEAE